MRCFSRCRCTVAPFGVGAALINPSPYATGFNDRMANDPGDWFDRNTADPEDVAIVDSLVQRITVGQHDPAEVVKRYVGLVEADQPEPVNFIPKDLLERLSKPKST